VPAPAQLPLLEPAREARRAAALAGCRSLFRLHGRLVRTRNICLEELGLTSARLRILEVIALYPGSNLSAIAARLDLSRQAVHRVVHDLVREEMLVLRRDPADGRALTPVITEFGDIYATGALEWQAGASLELTSILRLEDLQFTKAVADRLWREMP